MRKSKNNQKQNLNRLNIIEMKSIVGSGNTDGDPPKIIIRL